jgi:hypothetical protein
MFVTAFHEQQNSDLSKFSTGTYIYPDTDFNNLSDLSMLAQSQMRFAVIYKRVDEWAVAPPNVATTSAEDIDQDGETEYLLYNATSFAVFESIGGRCVAAFARNPVSGSVYQIIGTQPAYAGSETEEEGTEHVTDGSIGARRTSAFKDWFANGSGGNNQFINSLYGVVPSGSNGWIFTAPGSDITKTITLDDTLPELKADYVINGTTVDKLYVRHGLSPNLWNLIARGHYDLDNLSVSEGRIRLANRGGAEPVIAQITYDTTTTIYNGDAIDDQPGILEWDSLNMRNQALTQQVEFTNVDGQNSLSMTLALENGITDNDSDGLPNWWELDNNLDPESALGNDGRNGNEDGDAFANFEEYVLGLDLGLVDFNGLPKGLISKNLENDFTITFPVLAGRSYRVWYVDDLTQPWQPAGDRFSIADDDPTYIWTDDGSNTTPQPSSVDLRFFKIEIARP